MLSVFGEQKMVSRVTIVKKPSDASVEPVIALDLRDFLERDAKNLKNYEKKYRDLPRGGQLNITWDPNCSKIKIETYAPPDVEAPPHLPVENKSAERASLRQLAKLWRTYWGEANKFEKAAWITTLITIVVSVVLAVVSLTFSILGSFGNPAKDTPKSDFNNYWGTKLGSLATLVIPIMNIFQFILQGMQTAYARRVVP